MDAPQTPFDSSALRIRLKGLDMIKTIQVFLLAALLAVTGIASAQSSRVQGTISTQNLAPTGAATTLSAVEIDVSNKGCVGVEVTNTYTGALSSQSTTDGVTWKTLAPTPFVPATATGTPTATIGSGVTGQWQVGVMVPGSIRLRVTGLAAMSGGAAVTLQSSPVACATSGGAAAGGGLTDAELRATPVPVSGTVTATPSGTQAVSAASGSFASGALASGSVASGALAAGSVASGAMVDLGLITDAAATAGSTGTIHAKQRLMTSQLDAINTSINAATTQLPADGTGAVVSADSFPTTGATNDMGPVAPAAATATRGVVPVGTYNTTAPVMTNTQQGGFQLDVNGRLIVAHQDVLIGGGALSLTANGNFFTDEDMSGFECLVIHYTSSGGGGTVTPGHTNVSGASYVTTWSGLNANNNSATAVSQTTNTTGIIRWPRAGRYAQAVLSGYVSGTNTMYAVKTRTACTPTAGPGGVTASGVAAHDAAISGNPVRIAGHAVTANPTAVATGDTVNWIGTTVGAQIVYPWSIPDGTWQYASAADVTDTTSTEMTAAVASTRKYTKTCTFSNTDATVGTYINILSASTVIGVVYVAAQVAATAGSNSLHVEFTPPLRGGVNEAINFQAVTTSAQLRTACQGFASTH